MPKFSLTLDRVSLSRGITPIVSDLTLQVSNGELLWICGANGIGKSSVLRLAAGLLRPDEGHVAWSINDASVMAGQIVSYQAHKDPLKPSLSLRENLAFWAQPLGRAKEISNALNAVGLNGFDNRRAGTLSAGQSRRTVLAKLLIEDKPLWIMDEPAAAIDHDGIMMIGSLISAHISKGGAVIMASHAAPEALANTARLLTLKAPKLALTT